MIALRIKRKNMLNQKFTWNNGADSGITKLAKKLLKLDLCDHFYQVSSRRSMFQNFLMLSIGV